MTKFIQISDTHIIAQNRLAYGRVDTAAALEACVASINRLLPNIDPVEMVVVTGDLTDFGAIEDYQCFRDIMAPLAIPYRVIPGNHDDREHLREGFLDQDWMPKSGPINWSADFTDLAIIGLDSSVHGHSHGHLSDDTLVYLTDRLNELNAKPVCVAIHHPPFLTGMEKMDVHNLRESEALKAILSSYGGELRLICGHIHRNIVTQFGKVICQTAPGTSHAVSMNQQIDAENCLTKEPNGFLLHEIRGGIVSHHIPIGNFDGPHPFH